MTFFCWIANIFRKTNIPLFAAALGCILASLAIKKIYPPASNAVTELWSSETLSEFLREIGFAFGIAFVIIATIETETRREFREEISREVDKIKQGVFSATYKRRLPDTLINGVEHLIFESHFIRNYCKLYYDLSFQDHTNKDNTRVRYVKCSLCCISEYENISGTSVDFDVIAAVGVYPFEPLSAAEVSIKSLKVNGTDVKVDLKSSVSEDVVMTEGRLIGVQPKDKVTVTSQLDCYKLESDYQIWGSTYNTLRCDGHITFPKGLAMKDIDSLHWLGLDIAHPTGDTIAFEFRGPILRNQGLQFFWVATNPFN